MQGLRNLEKIGKNVVTLRMARNGRVVMLVREAHTSILTEVYKEEMQCEERMVQIYRLVNFTEYTLLAFGMGSALLFWILSST